MSFSEVGDLFAEYVVRPKARVRERDIRLWRRTVTPEPVFDGGAFIAVPVLRDHGIVHQLMCDRTEVLGRGVRASRASSPPGANIRDPGVGHGGGE